MPPPRKRLPAEAEAKDRLKVICRRLKPGDELFSAIEKLAAEENIQAGTLLSIVGSLTSATLRYAGQEEATVLEGPFEVVSGTGVVAVSGSHLHLSIADKDGKTSGGHFMSGNYVHTTIELAILDLSEHYSFKREFCPLSGYDELAVVARCDTV